MVKEQVIAFRDGIGKGKILKVVCDNQHIFYDGTTDNSPIMWDDENEVFTVCRVNQDAAMQRKYPYETVQTAYEHIQFMHCYDTRLSVLDVVAEKGTNLSDEQIGHFKDYVSRTSSNYGDNWRKGNLKGETNLYKD